MKYKGIELKEVTEPQVFNPPKNMLVWNDLSSKPKEAYVVAIIPQFSAYGNMNVIGPYDGVGSGYNSYYAHCAEIPEELNPRRATNRELAKWLAQGNGEWGISKFGVIEKAEIGWFYDTGYEKQILQSELRVRKWGDAEWHEPTAYYLGLE